MIDFAAFNLALSLAVLGTLFGEFLRLFLGFQLWLKASFGWAGSLGVFVIFANATLLALSDAAPGAATTTDVLGIVLAPLLYAALWLLVVNAVGVLRGKSSRNL